MHRLLKTLLLLPTAALAAGEDPSDDEKRRSALSLLPEGSQLHGVMFPRYDEELNLTGILQARCMTLVDDTTVSGENITVRLFNKDGTQRGRVDLTNAWLDQTNHFIKTPEPVTLHSDQVTAQGAGLSYAFEQGEGFLLGPVKTWFESQHATAMNFRQAPLKSTASISASLLMLPLAAQPSTTPSSAVTAQLGNKQTRAELRADLDASDAATAAARKFLEQAELTSSEPAPHATVPNQPKPLEVSPSPDDTVVRSDNGMYFDADQGLFVFLRNVRVNDPRFELTGANELKIFLEVNDEENPEPRKQDDAGMAISADFGDVERILATGAVRFLQKQPEPGKEPVEASGAIFTYHPKTGDITISGGFPWVKQGTTYMRAKEPNLTLRIRENGSFVTEGNWEMGGRLDQAR